ncbi:MAG: efflux RND transporter permease subunit, partial [Nitrospiraceae bacterium]
ALLIAFTLAPILCAVFLTDPIREEDTTVVRAIRRTYMSVLKWALRHRVIVVGVSLALLVVALLAMQFVGGEFMPALEEGNLWVRATMPVDISFEQASGLATEIRTIFQRFPEVSNAVSQLGRPDDGTDPTSFFNAEFLVTLKPPEEWRPEVTSKEKLIEEAEAILSHLPGVTFNFSQMIQDNVQEAMSGVKGENSIKLFGPDLKLLEATAVEIERVMKEIPGVKDLGILRLMGQPNLMIRVDREACARYGLVVADVNAVVQAAVGGQAVTRVFEGERWFDLVVRFQPEYRQDIETIGNIQVSTPEGARIPFKQLASISTQAGAFIIYRENNERYIPIKFSVRGRDLESTVQEAQAKIARQVTLPERYRIEWAGEYDQLKDEQQRLTIVVPLAMLAILFLLYAVFNTVGDALLVLVTIPFALIGGVLSLVVTRTPFSISAAVGVISTLGVAILGGVLLISRIGEFRRSGLALEEAILKGADVQMRPVLMATLAAAIGLLPAAVATGIGSQAQQPLARVVVGGMLTSAVLILLVLPVLYQLLHRQRNTGGGG